MYFNNLKPGGEHVKISKYMSGFFGAYYLLSGLVALLFTNFTFGCVISVFIGAYLCLYSRHDTVKRIFKTKVLKVLKYLCLAGCIFVIVFSLFLEIYGRVDNTTGNEDAVIVLGAAVKGDKISAALKSRLDTAYEYCKDNSDAVVVVSGGKGNNENMSEAEAMEKYLVSLGIEKNRIIKEDKSTSTKENVEFSKNILDKKLGKNYKTVIITNNFHILRASIVAKDAGLDFTHAGGDMYWIDIATNCARETFALLKYAVIG